MLLVSLSVTFGYIMLTVICFREFLGPDNFSCEIYIFTTFLFPPGFSVPYFLQCYRFYFFHKYIKRTNSTKNFYERLKSRKNLSLDDFDESDDELFEIDLESITSAEQQQTLEETQVRQYAKYANEIEKISNEEFLSSKKWLMFIFSLMLILHLIVALVEIATIRSVPSNIAGCRLKTQWVFLSLLFVLYMALLVLAIVALHRSREKIGLRKEMLHILSVCILFVTIFLIINVYHNLFKTINSHVPVSLLIVMMICLSYYVTVLSPLVISFKTEKGKVVDIDVDIVKNGPDMDKVLDNDEYITYFYEHLIEEHTSQYLALYFEFRTVLGTITEKIIDEHYANILYKYYREKSPHYCAAIYKTKAYLPEKFNKDTVQRSTEYIELYIRKHLFPRFKKSFHYYNICVEEKKSI